jgi:hypothetical protein
MKHWVQSLFRREELAVHLAKDRDDPSVPSGHVLRSRGYKQKVTDNPHINQDRRNIALAGTTDGVPFFDDQRRGAWPFLLRCVDLPDGLSMNTANVHLHLLSGNEYFEVDEGPNILRRRIRGPKSLQPHLHIIVDDLLDFYYNGTFNHLFVP